MKIIVSFFILFFFTFAFGQKAEITGIITDEVNQPIVGAKIVLTGKTIDGTKKAASDNEGKYQIKDVPFGKYILTISMFSYDTVFKQVNIEKSLVVQDIILGGSQELEEVKIIGNIVTKERNVPIAVTKIPLQKIKEELASRDLPMLLMGTAGVYATQKGGGDGDARINVRGFDQRNVGVLIDGVPVNDMENGWVYWSNWFGLDAITSTVQVQRGLGATRLAMPSLGGTINILTQGVGNKKGVSFKQEYGTGNMLRSTFSYNSGMTKKGWGLTFSASYKQSDGWVYGTPSQGAFGYIKVQKKINKHLLSLSAFSAPQKHGQRSYNQAIQYWNTDYARTQPGMIIDSTTNFFNKGIRYNQHWGYRTVDGKQTVMNENLNYYNKPQITLKDFWKINDKLSISNIAYISIGRGGGTRLYNTGNGIIRDSNQLIYWDAIIANNQVNSLFGGPNVDPAYSPTLIKSNQCLLSTVNNHFWAGYLGQFNYEYSKSLVFSGGIDYRYYKGTHYQKITDLLGGDYFVDYSNSNAVSPMKKVGDEIALKPYNNHRDGLVNWMAAFGQAEYTGKKWSAFVNLSSTVNGYKGIDYFQKRVLDVGDTTLRIGYGDTITYNGNVYTDQSAGLTNFQTTWKMIPGFTFKAGASYSINENSSAFMNIGYLSRTPQFNNVIDNNYNKFFDEILNEKIIAIEGGYAFANKKIGINLNGYFTNWQNKPFPFGVSVPDPNDPTQTIAININGMDAIHMGGELDVAYKINKKLTTDFMFSLGNWFWNSAETVYVPQYNYTLSFDAKGVHVGDAAQTAIAASIRYEPIRNLYFKIQGQYFDRYYADFNPFYLQGDNGGRDAWKIPSYYLVNVFGGYKIDMKKFDVIFNGSITNVLNSTYISEATDNKNTPYFDSDAKSAQVMFGQGFRFNLSLGIQF